MIAIREKLSRSVRYSAPAARCVPDTSTSGSPSMHSRSVPSRLMPSPSVTPRTHRRIADSPPTRQP